MILMGLWGGFLHNEPLPSFIDSPLPVFFLLISLLLLISFPYGFGPILSLCWLPLPVAASDLSAPKKCRARFGLDQQNNWCGPCRCVWCVLALAGARWGLANCTLGLPPSLSAAAFSSSSPPSVCSAKLLWPLSFLQPRPAGLSLGSHYVICTSCLGRRVLTAYARVFVWMSAVRMCLWRNILRGLQGFRCRMYSTISLSEIVQKSLTGRFGLGGSEAWWFGRYGGYPSVASLNLSPGYMFLSVQWRVHFLLFFLFFCLCVYVCVFG